MKEKSLQEIKNKMVSQGLAAPASVSIGQGIYNGLEKKGCPPVVSKIAAGSTAIATQVVVSEVIEKKMPDIKKGVEKAINSIIDNAPKLIGKK